MLVWRLCNKWLSTRCTVGTTLRDTRRSFWREWTSTSQPSEVDKGQFGGMNIFLCNLFTHTQTHKHVSPSALTRTTNSHSLPFSLRFTNPIHVCTNPPWFMSYIILRVSNALHCSFHLRILEKRPGCSCDTTYLIMDAIVYTLD